MSAIYEPCQSLIYLPSLPSLAIFIFYFFICKYSPCIYHIHHSPSLVLETSMLYEVFERLIFSVSCVYLSRFGRYCVFVQVVLVISIWQGWTDVFVLDCGKWSVFYVCLSVWCWNLYGVWVVANEYVSFFVTVVSRLGSCCVPFAGNLLLMYPPRRIGLLMLAVIWHNSACYKDMA